MTIALGVISFTLVLSVSFLFSLLSMGAVLLRLCCCPSHLDRPSHWHEVFKCRELFEPPHWFQWSHSDVWLHWNLSSPFRQMALHHICTTCFFLNMWLIPQRVFFQEYMGNLARWDNFFERPDLAHMASKGKPSFCSVLIILLYRCPSFSRLSSWLI